MDRESRKSRPHDHRRGCAEDGVARRHQGGSTLNSRWSACTARRFAATSAANASLTGWFRFWLCRTPPTVPEPLLLKVAPDDNRTLPVTNSLPRSRACAVRDADVRVDPTRGAGDVHLAPRRAMGTAVLLAIWCSVPKMIWPMTTPVLREILRS